MKSLQIPVAELMTRDLLIVAPSDSLERVRDIFAANPIHHIPVVDGAGVLAGIISKSDFNRVTHVLSILEPEKYKEFTEVLYRSLRAEEIMSRQPVTVGQADRVAVVAEIFQENLFHAIPVVDRGILVGLVTTHDLIRYCCTEPSLLD